MDKAEHEVHTSALERNKAAGDKVASEEAFVNEHKDYLSQVACPRDISLHPRPATLDHSPEKAFADEHIPLTGNAPTAGREDVTSPWGDDGGHAGGHQREGHHHHQNLKPRLS